MANALDELTDYRMRRQCRDFRSGGKTKRTKKRHDQQDAAAIRRFAWHLEHRLCPGITEVCVSDWREMCVLDAFWIFCNGDLIAKVYFTWTFKEWPLLAGAYTVNVTNGITVAGDNLISGKLFVPPELDWRPSETIPEDYYAM